MFLGHVIKKQHKQYYGVNNYGFISIFGLFLLSVMTLFLTMLTLRIQTFYKISKTPLSDVFVLRHVHDVLKEQQGKETQPTNTDEHDENIQDNKEDTIKNDTEDLQFENCDIHIQYQSNAVFTNVSCNDARYSMRIDYDTETYEIVNYAYLDDFKEE